LIDAKNNVYRMTTYPMGLKPASEEEKKKAMKDFSVVRK
jgi:hypothetical protein